MLKYCKWYEKTRSCNFPGNFLRKEGKKFGGNFSPLLYQMKIYLAGKTAAKKIQRRPQSNENNAQWTHTHTHTHLHTHKHIRAHTVAAWPGIIKRFFRVTRVDLGKLNINSDFTLLSVGRDSEPYRTWQNIEKAATHKYTAMGFSIMYT